MSNVNVTLRVDEDLKKQADNLFSELGMSLSTAINIFLRQSVRENCIPFSIYREVPNADTIAAMKEAEEMASSPESYRRYGSFAELLAEVEPDA